MKGRWLRSLSPLVALFIGAACVPSRAGYEDVRSITSARVGADVHWHTQAEAQTPNPETRRLLATPLTKESAVQIALLNNASLQAAFERLGIARGSWVHARRLPNPSIDATVRYGAQERPEVDLDATISLSQFLYLPWRDGVGATELDAATLEVAGSAVDLAFDVQRAFLDYQAAAQRLELRRSIVESLKASVDIAQHLHEAGNVTDLALANERAFYEEARIAYASDEAAFAAEREQLTALMGLWGPLGSNWTAASMLPEPVSTSTLLNDLEQRALTSSLDLALARKRFETAAQKANLSQIEGWLPDLRGGISAERNESDWGLGPLAELTVPLFYQGQGTTEIALSEMRRERRTFTDTAVRLRARVRALSARLRTVTESVEYYESTLLPLRDEVLQQTQLQYNAMNASVFQLLQAKRDQIAAAQTYVSLLHDYWRLRAEAEQLLAGRLPTTRTSTNALSELASSMPEQAEH